jgi:crotonobetainyl-CoA:carnitine CoA-transferase CaiB-like acyl-CoA transferase
LESNTASDPDNGTYGQYGEPDYLGRPGYDALAQAFGGMMNIRATRLVRRSAPRLTRAITSPR